MNLINSHTGSATAGATVSFLAPLSDLLSRAVTGIIVGVSVWLITTGIKYLYARIKR